ncbi:Carboxypeptidase Z [Platysternon megacephalum]|uniref:Carboxypeptidase Z n=1 Tax=Platysternon megacephalum TaxID=55544 RepID=A0A4D9DKL6_9SAUR|nr:Carboxypeptidase Z [Platysternon megacephalum]
MPLDKGLRYLFPLAADGDYWRLLPPGRYIISAHATGYSKVMKRVTLPAKMRRAGRVDFLLRSLDTKPKNFLRGPMEDIYERYDPLEHFDPHAQHAQSEPREERGQPTWHNEKPWWWSYFSSLGQHKPLWLLKQR